VPLREARSGGIRIKGWLEQAKAGSGRSYWPRRQPAIGRIKGVELHVRCSAAYSPHENQTRGTVRSYLERRDAVPEIMHPAWIEGHPDRWGIWIRPSENVDPDVLASVLQDQLQERYGIEWADVYLVRHTDADGHQHYHAVTPAWVIVDEESGATKKVEITREDMTEIGREMVRELVLERQVERVFEAPENGSTGGRWDLPATEDQMRILRQHGRAARDLTRGEASLVIETLIGERSWYAGRDR
jgi:hypothetical protein